MKDSHSIQNFKDLTVWQKAFNLCLMIYQNTRKFPPDERYGLTSEIRKTARSIPYNISEGHKRRTTREYINFVGIAAGSGGELETQLLLAKALGYIDEDGSENLIALCDEVERMLYALRISLEKRGG